MALKTFYTGDVVKVQPLDWIAPRWRNKYGRVVRWAGNWDWYIVNVGGTELILDISRGEFVLSTDHVLKDAEGRRI